MKKQARVYNGKKRVLKKNNPFLTSSNDGPSAKTPEAFWDRKPVRENYKKDIN
jgi:hypothetical protein